MNHENFITFIVFERKPKNIMTTTTTTSAAVAAVAAVTTVSASARPRHFVFEVRRSLSTSQKRAELQRQASDLNSFGHKMPPLLLLPLRVRPLSGATSACARA